jgi:hypothetical protein
MFNAACIAAVPRPDLPGSQTPLLVVYGVTGPERGDLIALAKKARQPGLWRRADQSMRSRVTVLSLLESRATSIASWEPLLVPGLLQTIPYARALFREIGMVDDPEELDRRVVDRIHRQAVLRKPGAPKLTAFIGEAALRNPIGEKERLPSAAMSSSRSCLRPRADIRDSTGLFSGCGFRTGLPLCSPVVCARRSIWRTSVA